jgi:hypothetical protein
MHIFHSYNVQTMYIHEFAGICIYVGVHTCLDHVYTMYIHGMYNFTLPWTRNTKRKKLQRTGYDPTITCTTASCLNHYTTSMLASNTIVTVYIYCFTWLGRLVTRRRTSRTPRPPGPGPPWRSLPQVVGPAFQERSMSKQVDLFSAV